ncbi:hypothetical protein [Gluconobacter albidus]|nr:hypothetical protein [Gluconobacter albidus]MBS1029276.1 hypothetical protein [Gluconobacter albidus]
MFETKIRHSDMKRLLKSVSPLYKKHPEKKVSLQDACKIKKIIAAL